MNKAYSRINWQNAPSEATALNETNLNKMDSAIDVIDDRVVAHDTRLDNAEYAIGQAGDSITALQGDVSTLEGTVSTQGSAITALQSGKVDKSNGMGLSTLMNLEAQSRTNTGTIIGALLLDKYGQQVTEIKLRNGIEVDSALSDSSTNPVQNKAIKMALDEKVDKVAGKGLCDKSEVSVELPSGTPVGEEIATVVLKGQDGSDAIAYPIYNGVEVDSALSSESENPVQNKAVTTELENKADVDGNYEDMAVGQLLSNTFEEDKAPYNFRTSGGTLEIGDREYDTLVGGTVAWNQLCNMSYSETGISASGTKLTIASTISTGSRDKKVQDLNIPTNHVVLFTMNKKSGTMTGNVKLGLYHNTGTTSWQGLMDLSSANGVTSMVVKTTDSVEVLQLFLYTGFTISADFEADFNITDLTVMFGSTIADYIYSLERATAGSGVAYFRSLFPKDYYSYNAGQLMSVKALSHKTVGFNQWDEEWEVGTFDNSTGEKKSAPNYWRSKNRIKVLPNTLYYAFTSGDNVYRFYYDASGNYIGAEAGVINSIFTTPNNAYYLNIVDVTRNAYDKSSKPVCINLHWDGERDGEYEAYEEHIYPLDSDLELRGIPKLDANNQLYYDGDTYESDGTVTRKYAEVDLGDYDWAAISGGAFRTYIPDIKLGTTNLTASIYIQSSAATTNMPDFSIKCVGNSTQIIVKDSRYSGADAFEAAMNGVYLVYELATPTTETADTFTNPQLVDNWGTEEYTDSREVQIPVGHITKYPPDLKAKLESAPDSPSANGDYILRHNNGVNSYVALTKELPAVPTTDGTYVLKSTVSSGVATLSWVAE